MNHSAKRTKGTFALILSASLLLVSCGNKQKTPVASGMSSQSQSVTANPPSKVAQAVGSVRPTGTECPSGDLIKGKDSKNGKIYHVPNSSNYSATKATVCFPSVASAEKAGYRAPK